MSNIYPSFAHLADRQAAEAFSEMLVRQTEFKVETVDGLNEHSEFPPVPAYLDAVSTAYWVIDNNGPVMRRQTLIMQDEPAKRSASVNSHLEAYSKHVGSFHEIAHELDSIGVYIIGNIALRAAELALESKLRTVAAFVTFKAAEDDSIISGLIIPRHTFMSLPLEDRDQVSKLMNAATTKNPHIFDDAPDVKKIFQRVLQNDPSHARFAFMGAAINLPGTETLKNKLQQSVINQNIAANPNKSRADRRAEVLKDRRNRRRHH